MNQINNLSKSFNALAFPLKIFFQFVTWWCCHHFSKFLFISDYPKFRFRKGLEVVLFPLAMKMGDLYPLYIFKQVKWCSRCDGVCDAPFQRGLLMYVLLCYGRKARSAGSPKWCVSVVWMSESPPRLKNSKVGSGSTVLSLAFLDLARCLCGSPSSVWLVSCPTWSSLSLRYNGNPLIELEYFIIDQCKFVIHIWKAWFPMFFTKSQSIFITNHSAIVIFYFSSTWLPSLSSMDKGKQKIVEHLFSEVVKITSVEVKNSSPVGDVSLPCESGKTNKQKYEKQTLGLSCPFIQSSVEFSWTWYTIFGYLYACSSVYWWRSLIALDAPLKSHGHKSYQMSYIFAIINLSTKLSTYHINWMARHSASANLWKCLPWIKENKAIQ